jgi:hypothetical protein
MTDVQSERRRGTGAEQPDQQVPEAVADRLAGLLPEEALRDALEGVEGEEDHRARRAFVGATAASVGDGERV